MAQVRAVGAAGASGARVTDLAARAPSTDHAPATTRPPDAAATAAREHATRRGTATPGAAQVRRT